MGGPRAVRGHHRPVVVEQVGLVAAEGDHRLDRERHALDQAGAAASAADVGYVGRLVHRRADAVAGVVLEDAVAALLLAQPPLDRRGDVADPAAEPGRGDAGPQGGLGVGDQRDQVRRDPAHRHRDRGVAVPAVDDRAAVERDQVALTQLAVTRDAVHDLVVHRGADRGREALVPEERRRRPGGADGVLGDGVQVGGGHARAARRPAAPRGCGRRPARPAASTRPARAS